MLVVGLTGGIGSGKSTVAKMFAELDVPVFDADVEARALVAPGQPALQEIVAAFGTGVLAPDGSLDRKRMRELVFNDAHRRAQLEAILHPRVRQALELRIAATQAPYCIVVVPLLFEANQIDLVDRVLVVDAPDSTQMARTLERPGLTVGIVRSIMAAQWSREQRLAHADDVISNDRDLATLRTQVHQFHQQYLSKK